MGDPQREYTNSGGVAFMHAYGCVCLPVMHDVAAGAMALSAALAAASCNLKCLDLSGCDLTDRAVQALVGLLLPPPAAATASSSRSLLKWGMGSAAGHHRTMVEELRLVDNQITAAGVHAEGPVCVTHMCLSRGAA